MSILCMKTRNCLFLLAFLVGIAITAFLLVGNDAAQPAWDNLVSETQKHLQTLKKFNDQPGIHKTAENEPYFQKLCLHDPSKFPFSDKDLLKATPTIVVPALNGQGSDVLGLLTTLSRHLPDWPVVVYDLGLGYFERRNLKHKCNLTGVVSRCQIREVAWREFPSHIQNYGAYRPILIQEVLNSTGAVFFLTPNHRISSSDASSALELARATGVAAWPLTDPTSAITHHKVFSFFHTDEKKFYFHRTVSGERLLVVGFERVRRQLMVPWLQCALTLRCVAPLGAQESGCRTYRKPLFRYSGCHGYDWAVMNLVLGIMFDYESEKYSSSRPFFVTNPEELTTTTSSTVRIPT